MGGQGGREEEKGGGFRGDYPTDTLLYIILTNKDVLLMMATMLFIMLVIEDNITSTVHCQGVPLPLGVWTSLKELASQLQVEDDLPSVVIE